MEPFVHPPRTTSLSKKQIAAVLWELHLHGPIKDKSGQGSAKLLQRVTDMGVDMSINTLNRIVNSLSDREIGTNSDYPYHYINRVVNGRRTLVIELIVDPREVPFPPNPFKEQPRFQSANGDTEVKAAPPAPLVLPDEEETFARQGLFESFQNPKRVVPRAERKPEPEPESEPEIEPALEPVESELVEPEPEVVALPPATTIEPYEIETRVRTNGRVDPDDDIEDLFRLPDDLLADLDDAESRRSTDLIAKAMGLLSEAMAAVQTEQIDLVTSGIGQEIDRRFGQYAALQDRVQQREDQLRHVMAQYERVVEVARSLRKKNIALERRLAAVAAS